MVSDLRRGGGALSTPITGTFMFTDLVGSTAMASRLGPGATDELRQVHFGILRGAAAATGGIEVKSTGDGVMLMYTSPSRALSCAAAIQQGIDRHNRRGGEPLAVRIGVSMGEAVEEDGDYYGDCVVEAARLCDKAAGGQILTTDLVRALVGRHSTHAFREVGDLELKGIPEPVVAVEVLWEPEAAPGAIPLPSRLVGAATEGLFGFFGRREELDVLLEGARRAQSDARTEVILLAGEPGIGKTTLAAQAARTLHADGATVLFGHCAEGLSVPYQPWIEALCHLVEHAPDDLLTGHVDAHGAALARLVPTLTRRIPSAVPADDSSMADGERYALLEAIRGLLTAAATDGLALVLDDVQWADTASLQVLRHLLAGGTPPPVLVVATYRDTDLSRDHPLTPFLADLRREPCASRLALGGLSDKELLALMEGAAGYEMEADGIALAQALHRETDGNPFFTGEMLRHLYETGAIAFDESGQYVLTVDLDDAPLPGSVRDVVIRRVDRLGDDVARTLTLAAVIGREFDLTVLDAIADDDEDTLLDHLEAAVNASLVTEVGELPGRFRFEHALIRHTLYQDLGATRRQRLHQRIAEALEALTGRHAPPVTELAHHWLAATRPSDVGKAIEYARLAGEQAIGALAPHDAIRWFTQALELQERLATDELGVHVDLVIGLGTAQKLAGMPEHRETLLEAGNLAIGIDDGDRVARAALAVASEVQSYDPDPRCPALLEAAVARVPPDSAVAARLYACWACETDARDRPAAEERARRAVDIASASGDDEALLHVLITRASVCAGPGELEERIADLDQAIAMADASDDHIASFVCRFQQSNNFVEAVDLGAARESFDEACAIASRLHLPLLDWQVRIVESGHAATAGDFVAAEAIADDALALATRAGIAEGLGTYGGQLHNIRVAQGRAAELAEFFVGAADAMPQIEPLRTAVVTVLLEVGDLDAAHERFARERAEGFTFARTVGWFNCMESTSDACVELGDRESAQLLLSQLRPFTDRLLASIAIAPRPVARYAGRLAGLLGLDDEAGTCFATALTLCDRLGGAPYWRARTLVDRAEWLRRRGAPGDIERANSDVDAALALAESIGADAIPQRVARLRAGT
jgi:class 3 adenylate cyclase